MLPGTFTAYREKGLSVFPVPYGSKKAVIQGWQKWCDELPPLELTEAWDKEYQDKPVNYALALGPASNICAIDVDVNGDEAKRIAPDSNFEKTGKKGYTRFYLYNPRHTSKKNFRGLHVDYLTRGAYTLLPPSKHPDGMEYKWSGLYQSLIHLMEPLPQLEDAVILTLESHNEVAVALAKKDGKLTGGRHVTLANIAIAMAHRGHDEAEIAEELRREDERLFPDNPYFKDASEKADPFKFAASIKRTVGEKERDRPLDVSKLLDQGGDDEDDEHFDPASSYRPVSIDFVQPRGVMRDVFEFVQMHSSQKEATSPLAIASSIAFMSSVAGRKFFANLAFEGETGLTITPNIYMIGLADSGFGKNAPKVALKKLLKGKGILNTNKWKSGSAFLKELSKNPIKLDFQDEVQSLFLAMSSEKASIHMIELQDYLMDAWSSADSTLGGTNAATEGASVKEIENPHFSLLGLTTPASFSKSVKPIMMSNGLFARMLFFNCEKRKLDLTRVGYSFPPEKEEAILKQTASCFSQISRLRSEMQRKHKNLIVDDKPLTFSFSREAQSESNDFALEYQAKAAAVSGQWIASFYNRMRENAARLALLDHLSLIFSGELREEIQIDSVQWGQAITLACFSSVFDKMEALGSIGNDYDSVLEAIRTRVATSGPYGIQASALNKKLAHKKEFQVALKNLETAREVIKMPGATPAGKRNPSVYYMTPAQRKSYYIDRGIKPPRLL